jgi:hypothetical protein
VPELAMITFPVAQNGLMFTQLWLLSNSRIAKKVSRLLDNRSESSAKILRGYVDEASVSLKSQAIDTFSALANATTSISVTGRCPFSILDKPD